MGKVSKASAAILIGIATIWPFAHIGLFVYFFFSGDNVFPVKEIPYRVQLLMSLTPVMFIAVLAVVVGFISFALASKAVSKDKKALWVALLAIGGILVTPFFWYHYIWKTLITNHDVDTAAANTAKHTESH